MSKWRGLPDRVRERVVRNIALVLLVVLLLLNNTSLRESGLYFLVVGSSYDLRVLLDLDETTEMRLTGCLFRRFIFQNEEHSL